jgi:hypothetical protein
MTTLNADNYTKYAAPDPINYLGCEWEGKVRAMYDTITLASAGIGTAINCGILRKGEVFIGSEIYNAAFGSGATLRLGDADDDDRYMAAQSVASAGQITGKEATAGFGYKATADTPLILTTGGAEMTGKIQIIIKKLAKN